MSTHRLLSLIALAHDALPLDLVLTGPMALLMTLGALSVPLLIIVLTLQSLQTLLMPDIHRSALNETASLPTLSHFRKAWHGRSLQHTLDGIQITVQAWPVPDATAIVKDAPIRPARSRGKQQQQPTTGVARFELRFKSLVSMPCNLKVVRRSSALYTEDSNGLTRDPAFDTLYITLADSEADIFALLDGFTRSQLILLAQHIRTLTLEDSQLQFDFIPVAETPPIDRLIAAGVDILARMCEHQTIAQRLERHLLEFPTDVIGARLLTLWLATGPQEPHRQQVLTRVVEGAEPVQALRAAQALGPEALEQLVQTLVPHATALPASVAAHMASQPDPRHLPLLNAWMETQAPDFQTLLARFRLGQDVPLPVLDDAYGRIKEIPQRTELIAQMAAMQDVHLDGLLCQLLQNPARSTGEKVALLEALATCGTPDALPSVRQCLDPREHERLRNAARKSIRTITVRSSGHVGALSLQDPASSEGQLSLTLHTGGEVSVVEDDVPGSRVKESV